MSRERIYTVSLSPFPDSPTGLHYRSGSATPKQEMGVDSPSEDHAVSPVPSLTFSKASPPQSSRPESVSSHDSRTESAGPRQTNGFHRSLPTEEISTNARPTAEAAPPALPPKTRKPKVLDVPKELEYSDRGDSDMDEDTYSSSHEKQMTKKVELVSVVI